MVFFFVLVFFFFVLFCFCVLCTESLNPQTKHCRNSRVYFKCSEESLFVLLSLSLSLCTQTVAMSEDMLLHFSSNSSNQSDQSLPTKMAKLEARMTGKPSSAPPPQQQQQPVLPPQQQQQQQQQPAWQSVSSAVTAKFGGGIDGLAASLSSSDSDDDDVRFLTL